MLDPEDLRPTVRRHLQRYGLISIAEGVLALAYMLANGITAVALYPKPAVYISFIGALAAGVLVCACALAGGVLVIRRAADERRWSPQRATRLAGRWTGALRVIKVLGVALIGGYAAANLAILSVYAGTGGVVATCVLLVVYTALVLGLIVAELGVELKCGVPYAEDYEADAGIQLDDDGDTTPDDVGI